MTDFSGIQLPNDVRSSLLSGLEFIAYFGPWVVIILGFIFLPFIHLALVQIVNEGNKTAKARTAAGKKKPAGKKKAAAGKKPAGKRTTKSSSRSAGAAKRPRKKREKLPTLEVQLDIEERTGRTIRREIIHHADGTKTETRQYDDDIKIRLKPPQLRAVQGGKSGR
ncbi:hypothetical protein [Paenibacillus kribbensis]|uniref:hypothetical protein n=1 Tax=Paenibacillus kribbensis TaxID=172713 RepID=UPI000838F581|nr:hypothetical protein [Paenibacillus kribbensis]